MLASVGGGSTYYQEGDGAGASHVGVRSVKNGSF